ncbi:MAG: tripartite tricarboxylate transporter TctB family protein [Deltaproteobacteria bacterium]|nr:tripartite tricarboxylate transporter TctB family protein [Deltaproteobacteria bacterium]
MKIRPHTIFGFLVLLFFGLVIWGAWGWPFKAKLYPLVIGVPMLAMAAFHVLMDLKEGRGNHVSLPEPDTGATPADIQFTKDVDPVIARRRTIDIFAWIFGFVLACWLVGLSVTIPPFVFLYLKVKSGEGWVLSIAMTGVVWLLYWGLFDQVLRLPLPEGKLYFWLGL